jgi:hypothetical protein
MFGSASHHQINETGWEEVTERLETGGYRGGGEEIRSGLGKSQADIRLLSNKEGQGIGRQGRAMQCRLFAS